MTAFSPTEFTLVCQGCGQEIDQAQVLLSHPDCPNPGLLRANYSQQQLVVRDTGWGLYRYADWLPVKRLLKGSSAPVTYRSERLGERLRLKNLWLTFNGYWPEIGAAMTTGTFKECEAYSVCASLPEVFDQTLVVASAGNTARAFARVCSDNDIPLIVFVPEQYLSAMWFKEPIKPHVKLVAAGGDSDYLDAIYLADLLCESDGYIQEGGAKNIARRDGMGTTMLSAATTIGGLPDYYFQAVGSGTGAIAAWEAAIRLVRDGRFGSHMPRMITSQNAPFLLLRESWHGGSRELAQIEPELARQQVSQIVATVLSNRKPPYGIPGGFYDTMAGTEGDVLAVDNTATLLAARLFQDLEGIDIAPEAGVAVASLIQALEQGLVSRDDHIMVNVTGGGAEKLKQSDGFFQLEPALVIEREDFHEDKVINLIAGLR